MYYFEARNTELFRKRTFSSFRFRTHLPPLRFAEDFLAGCVLLGFDCFLVVGRRFVVISLRVSLDKGARENNRNTHTHKHKKREAEYNSLGLSFFFPLRGGWLSRTAITQRPPEARADDRVSLMMAWLANLPIISWLVRLFCAWSSPINGTERLCCCCCCCCRRRCWPPPDRCGLAFSWTVVWSLHDLPINDAIGLNSDRFQHRSGRMSLGFLPDMNKLPRYGEGSHWSGELLHW